MNRLIFLALFAAIFFSFSVTSVSADDDCGNEITVSFSPMKPGLDGFNLTTEYQGEWGITFGGNSLPDNFVWDGKLLNPTTVIFPTKVCRVRVTFKDRDSNTQDHILIASDKWGKEVAKAAVRKNGMSALPTVLTVKNANIWYVDVKHVPDGEVQLLAISYKTKM